MRFELEALPQIGQETTADGTPLLLPLEAIDEDPLQPRSEFDPEPLRQLAASIAQRGVLQAISVRRHPDKPDCWMLNFGARRLRASKLAGQTQIPAYVNETATSYDQVIENEQREGLKPLELALFVQSRIALGESQADIARQLGKSQPYITYATALIDAPDWLMEAYRQRKCRGMAELYYLRRLHAQAAQHVRAWVEQQSIISRSDIQRLRTELDGEADAAKVVESADAGSATTATPIALSGRAMPLRKAADLNVSEQAAPAAATRKAISGASADHHRDVKPLFGEWGGQVVEIVLDAVPPAPRHVFVRMPGAIALTEVAARDLVLVGFQSDSER